MGPVSEFSREIFEEDIEGKNINDTLFRSYDNEHKIVSTFNFNIACSFGSDIVQWDMLKDNHPRKLIFLNPDKREKSLRMNVTPLWDKNDLLEKIMLVIEDITEIELLEKEMKKKDDESRRNIQILNEIGKYKKEDLELYFSGIFKNIKANSIFF